MDEELPDLARIQIELKSSPVVSPGDHYAVTMAVYGMLVHTAYFNRWEDAIECADSILTGRIGGVMYSPNTSLDLVVVGLGGLFGGSICGFSLSKSRIYNNNKNDNFKSLIVIIGWAIAFLIGETAYQFGTGSVIFGGSLRHFVAFLSLLIIGILGGGITMTTVETSPFKTAIGVLCWCLGLILGYGVSGVVGELLIRLLSDLNYMVRLTLLNLIVGFLYGAIAGWIGSWVMLKAIKIGDQSTASI